MPRDTRDPKRAARIFARVRLKHLCAVIRDRWAEGLPADADALLVRAIADHMAAAEIEVGTRILRLASIWNAPPDEVIAASSRCERGDGLIWQAEDLARVVGLSAEDRIRLGVWSIRPAGWSALDMSEARRNRRREKAERKRRAAGKPTRREMREGSAAAEAERLGVSRATIMRRRRAERLAAADTHTCPANIIMMGHASVSMESEQSDNATAPSARRVAGGDR